MRNFLFFIVLALFFDGCTSTPTKTNKLIIGKSDKVHYYYTMDNKKVKKYVDIYLFNNGNELYPIKRKHYVLGKSYKPMLRYWINSDSTLLLRQFARLGYIDTILYPVSENHYASKPDDKGDVIHFVVLKNSFDRSNFWSSKKVNLESTKKTSTTHSPAVNALERATEAGRAAGRKQALADITTTQNGSSYLIGVQAASSGRVIGTIAIGKYGHKRSNALHYIKSSCRDIDVDVEHKKSAIRTCIKAAIAKYNTY